MCQTGLPTARAAQRSAGSGAPCAPPSPCPRSAAAGETRAVVVAGGAADVMALVATLVSLPTPQARQVLLQGRAGGGARESQRASCVRSRGSRAGFKQGTEDSRGGEEGAEGGDASAYAAAQARGGSPVGTVPARQKLAGGIARSDSAGGAGGKRRWRGAGPSRGRCPCCTWMMEAVAASVE